MSATVIELKPRPETPIQRAVTKMVSQTYLDGWEAGFEAGKTMRRTESFVEGAGWSIAVCLTLFCLGLIAL